MPNKGIACFCIGPKNGEPLCRCRMKNVMIINGRYVERRNHDLGPVAKPISKEIQKIINDKYNN